MMIDHAAYKWQIEQACKYLSDQGILQVDTVLVIGSGMSGVTSAWGSELEIPYDAIPHYHGCSVEGHQGKITVASTSSNLVILQGRLHAYEGYTPQEVTFLIRVLKHLGMKHLILTNAAGCINPALKPGQIMMLTDHINFTGMNPLMGPHDMDAGSRFPDMSDVYNRAFRDWIFGQLKNMEETSCQTQLGFPKQFVQKGVYIGVLGPSYETPAEIRAFQQWGADAVGMSTVWEAIVANQLGVRVVGISLLSNYAAGIIQRPLSHDEVMETGANAQPNLTAFLKWLVPSIHEQSTGRS
jgi:purine-nucleoside phosphorylase